MGGGASAAAALGSEASHDDLVSLAAALPAERLAAIKGALDTLESKGGSTEPKKGVSKTTALMEKLGGRSKVLELAGTSQKIEALVHQKGALRQDPIYQGAGLQKLIADGAALKPKFDELCFKAAEQFTKTTGLSCEATVAPVKSIVRAEVKVRVDYNGNPLEIKDVVRGTLNITASPDPKTLQQAYAGLEDFVKRCGKLVPGVNASVVQFKDRYQKPRGGYSDWQFFLKMNGLVCELQVNFAAALEEKEDTQHKAYELERMAQDNLQFAAMRGDGTAVRLSLKSVGTVQITDSLGCTPLHYAAAYGHREMCADLLKAGADPLELDGHGRLPIHHAMVRGFDGAAEEILEHMDASKLQDISLTMGQALVSAWSVGSESMVNKMSELFKEAQMSRTMRLFYAVTGSCSRACEWTLQEAGGWDSTLCFVPFWLKSGFVLDCAITSGDIEIVKMLLDADGFPTRVHIHDEPDDDSEDAEDAVGLQEAALAYARLDMSASVEAVCVVATQKEQPLDMEELLMAAAKHQGFNTIELLLRRGTALSGRCQDLEAQILTCASEGNFKGVDLILEAKVDVNVSVSGYNALSVAVEAGDLKMCKHLLDRGADCDAFVETAADIEPYTAVCNAICFGRLEIMRFFHSRGADFTAPCAGSRDALAFALTMYTEAQDEDEKAEKTPMVALIEALSSASSP